MHGASAYLETANEGEVGIFSTLHQHLERMDTRQIFDLVFKDELTNIPNRKFLNFFMNAQERKEKQKEVKSRDTTKKGIKALYFIDLNKFKPVNDQYGHHIGDELLRLVARRLDKITRKEDRIFKISNISKIFNENEESFACRIGGDEFVVHACIKSESAINILKERILTALETPFKTSVGLINIGGSIGVKQLDEDENWERALQEADKMMYQLKEASAR